MSDPAGSRQSRDSDDPPPEAWQAKHMYDSDAAELVVFEDPSADVSVTAAWVASDVFVPRVLSR